ncbi:hypothetical protein NBH00_17090 [Paraconexibacter antarcticus]|uniref:Uncharacterized protein n=1 Tax=Paraconexibacter antarcticus TaxID=2949664 RepID=A0ABY5DR75_9ACTN|nr:hypothetical protein [Paraconexibacter antarcticus]UTI63069.1 hypothetical protein NBH00_17090 [Paraconexibacter antarcticus]
MTRKTIVTNMAVIGCDVCGRTLLRGENADVFLHGGSRRTVCELCTTRAMHEGWIREGVDDALSGRRSGERTSARSLLGRLRSRARADRAGDDPVPEATPVYDPASYDPDHYTPAHGAGEMPAPVAAPAPAPAPAPVAHAPITASHAPAAPAQWPADDAPRDRGISAVPTNAERKVARALEVFNLGPHTRTVSGVSRSLGAPMVASRPSATEGSVVTIVVAWELSWYRYEVDLGDEASGARVTGQGTELAELPAEDRVANVRADEGGFLHPAAELA